MFIFQEGLRFLTRSCTKPFWPLDVEQQGPTLRWALSNVQRCLWCLDGSRSCSWLSDEAKFVLQLWDQSFLVWTVLIVLQVLLHGHPPSQAFCLLQRHTFSPRMAVPLVLTHPKTKRKSLYGALSAQAAAEDHPLSPEFKASPTQVQCWHSELTHCTWLVVQCPWFSFSKCVFWGDLVAKLSSHLESLRC